MACRLGALALQPMRALMQLLGLAVLLSSEGVHSSSMGLPDRRRELLAAGYQYELTFGNGTGSQPGQFNNIFGIQAMPGGTVFVCDQLNNRIQQLAENGTVLAVWGNGTAGAGLYDRNQPGNIVLSHDGTSFLIADAGNRRIKVTSLDGSTQSALYFPFFDSPIGVAASPTGIYVTDFNGNFFVKFDPSTKYLWAVRATGSGNGQFIRPWGIAVGSNVLVNGSVVEEVVYVADNNNHRVQLFNGADGSYLAQRP